MFTGRGYVTSDDYTNDFRFYQHMLRYVGKIKSIQWNNTEGDKAGVNMSEKLRKPEGHK